ncbi:MAG TPA: transposase, partial [Bacteroidia bacterium]|nr:transposase [Bacteroidia bacterium]
VITNDMNMSNKDVVRFYCQRGDFENLFKDLNQFSFDLLPMRTLSNNTVFLLTEALCYILFTFIKRLFAGVLKFVKRNMQLNTFIKQFMYVATKWNGDELIIFGGDKDYSPLSGFT